MCHCQWQRRNAVTVEREQETWSLGASGQVFLAHYSQMIWLALALLCPVVLGSRVELLFNDNWLFHLAAGLPSPWDAPFAPALPFPIDLNDTVVHGLADAPAGNASAAACAAACAANYTCQAWQYCAVRVADALCAGGVDAGAADCAFPVDLGGQQCDGLHAHGAASEAECAAACCADDACAVYQWCGASGECESQGANACWLGSLAGGCSAVGGWQSRARNVTPGAACQTGRLADYGPGNWQTSGAQHWVGGARLAPPPPGAQPPSSPGGVGFDDSAFERLQLPHDYMARFAATNVNATPHQNEHGSIPFADAWYRKHFSVPAGTLAARLYFDGAYRSASVFLNGALAAQHEEGYTGFSVWLHNVSGAPLLLGGPQNVVALFLASTVYTFELWGFEGAGITRDVTLILHDAALSIAPWGVAAGAQVSGAVAAPGGADGPLSADSIVAPAVDVANAAAAAAAVFTLSAQVVAPGGAVVGASTLDATLPPGGWARLWPPPIALAAAALWSPANSPAAPRRPLYTLVVSLLDAASGALLDSLNTTFGIRRVVFDAAAGLSVNGFPHKMRGLSIHSDFAGTGAYSPPNIQAYRVQRLLDIGANAWRCAHNPVDSRLLDETDARGVMVWEEARFLRGFDQYVQDAGDMVARDRNHPSIFMWSLCSELGCFFLFVRCRRRRSRQPFSPQFASLPSPPPPLQTKMAVARRRDGRARPRASCPARASPSASWRTSRRSTPRAP